MLEQDEKEPSVNPNANKPRYRPREAFKRANALSREDFFEILNLRKCPESRYNAAEFKCSGCCVKSFAFNDDLSRGMETLRKHIWIEPKRIAEAIPNEEQFRSVKAKYEKLEGTVIRKTTLLDTLFGLRQ